MASRRARERIDRMDVVDVSGLDPTAKVLSIGGIRVHDIGQGDSISVLDETGAPFLQIDYGGRVGNPFVRAGQIDCRMPVPEDRLLMLSHWDEDHWCSAPKGSSARAASWLVPRQTTSPRAVKFSTTLARIHCVPERLNGKAYVFTTQKGDEIWWEKIAPAPGSTIFEEDCNRTGISFSIVKKAAVTGQPAQVILLPGDAPYGAVAHYLEHRELGSVLRGMVAFHHGTRQHLTAGTRSLLRDWRAVADPVDVVFSCALNNSYGHPDKKFYLSLPYRLRLRTTPDARQEGTNHCDLLF